MRLTAHRLPALMAGGIVSMVLLAAGCRPGEIGGRLDGDRAFREVEALVQISPRDAGTPNARRAAEHILQRLHDFGIDASIDTFTDETPAGSKTFHNVVGRIPGSSGDWIILGSHFDTMPGIENFQGANDGGSSTGVLLELARMLAVAKPRTGILFAFFDGEEGIAGYVPGDGLHGSRHMAEQLLQRGESRKIRAMILLDMVGDPDLHFVIPANSSRGLAKAVLDAAHATGYRNYFSLSQSSVITDDHVPFLRIGIPAIDIIDFKFGSESGSNDYWHTEHDHLGNLSAESLGIAGTVVLETVKTMMDD